MAQKPSLFNALGSAMAALLGVQKSEKHQEDFDSETPFPFILAGVIVVIGFILILATIVKIIIT